MLCVVVAYATLPFDPTNSNRKMTTENYRSDVRVSGNAHRASARRVTVLSRNPAPMRVLIVRKAEENEGGEEQHLRRESRHI